MMLFRSVSVLFLILVGLPCFGQDITVRVINAANGHPLKKVSLAVNLMTALNEFGRGLRLETDANGEARFTLSEPAPAAIRVNAVVSKRAWDCGCIAVGTTADVIQNGIAASPTVHSKPTAAGSGLKATPGQILIPVRPLSFSERLYMFFLAQ